ncbi:MAG: hypothetical protein JW963_15145 [Anaerolineales bacterium]|nr:hypothetical protein [Anaerolineales bacterium]
MSWQNQLKGDSLSWLLESGSPGVRYLALRDLADDAKEPEISNAREAAHKGGPIATILEEMSGEGYWAKEGPGYLPKYHSTVWALVMLAQLGASAQQDERIALACSYLLEHALAPGGQFSTSGAPSGTADCLQGNMCWALTELGYEDPRLDLAYEWMARSVTGEGVAPAHEKEASLRFYAGKCGPVFCCGSNNKMPCAWGAAKVMIAFSVLPKESRTPLIDDAIRQGVDFLFSVDPAEATYPSGWSAKPSGNWWKFGFPVFYVTDILQIVEALIGLGYGRDPRLGNALTLIREKQDEEGRWPLEYDYTGKTWVDFGPKKEPNQWVTLRALRVLKAVA